MDAESPIRELTMAESFRNEQLKPKSGECHKCHGVGNMARDCPNSEGGKQRTCRECGEGGHLKADCPNVKCRRCEERGHVALVCPLLRKKKVGRGRWIPHQAYEKAAKEEEAAPPEENFAQHEEPKVSEQWKNFRRNQLSTMTTSLRRWPSWRRAMAVKKKTMDLVSKDRIELQS